MAGQTRRFDASDLAGSVVARFEKQVVAFADKPAVVSDRHRWSYADLNRRANTVAHELLAHGENGCAALLLGHDAPMIAAILGTLKAGWTYVPLDASFPRDRLHYMAADAEVRVIVASGSDTSLDTAKAILPTSASTVLDLDALETTDAPNPGIAIEPGQRAYILYTSGSTGQPKGVQQSHQGILHHIRVWTDALAIAPEDRMTLLSSFSWDSSIQDMYGALLNGATTYPIDVTTTGLDRMVDCLLDNRLTIYHAAVPLHRHVTKALLHRGAVPDALRIVALGADMIYERDVAQFRDAFAPGAVMVNAYGATESTTGLIYKLETSAEPPTYPIPIGAPVEDTHITLVDDDGRAVPTGEAGEITIESPFVALGYLNLPEETAAKFIPHPEKTGTQTYRTGDLARRLPDGNHVLLGRKDSLIKIRGLRVEPSEIERLLRGLPAVDEAVVVARDMPSGDKRLVAYLVAADGETIDLGGVRSSLKGRLPSFMVPSAFVPLDDLPLTATRKVDRRRLPEPDWSTLSEAGYVAPSSRTETALAEIWAAHLKIARVGVEDDFFELGGDSLMALEIAMDAGRAGFGVTAPMLFEHPTIAALAKAATTLTVAPDAPSDADGPGADGTPASAAQWGIFFECLMAISKNQPYVEQTLFTVHDLDEAAFEQAWQGIVDREAILRTGFRRRPGGLNQHPIADLPVPMERHDWRDRSPAEQADGIAALAADQVARKFKLTEPPLFRLVSIRTRDDEHRVIWTYHHIIIDGWSEMLLLSDLAAVYRTIVEKNVETLPPRPPFSAYVAWLQAQDLAPSETYWRDAFNGYASASPAPEPIDPPDGGGMAVSELALPIGALKESAQRYRITLSTLLQGVWLLALGAERDTNEMVMSTVVSGRDTGFSDAGNVVGLLASVIPVRLTIEPAESLSAWLVAVQRELSLARRHSKVPLRRIIELAKSESEWDGALDNVFVYFDAEAVVPAVHDPRLCIEDLESKTAMPYPIALTINTSAMPQAQLIERGVGTSGGSDLLARYGRLVETVATERAPISVSDLMATR